MNSRKSSHLGIVTSADGHISFSTPALLARIFELEAQLRSCEIAIAQQTALAATDALTGIPNRRAVLEHLEQALDQEKNGLSVSESAPLEEKRKSEAVGVALGFIDLDDFKKINDTYGHEAGDKILKEVAKLLAETLRDTDTFELYQVPEEKLEMAGRLGGDEFILILRHTDTNQLAKRRLEIESTLNMLTVEITDKNGQKIKLPVKGTLGLIDCDLSLSADENLDRADKAMYDLKATKKAKIEETLASQRFAIMLNQFVPGLS
jgi:diguanylate cyclase (GGDEF)-like protein